jgi:hypothetical protein
VEKVSKSEVRTQVSGTWSEGAFRCPVTLAASTPPTAGAVARTRLPSRPMLLQLLYSPLRFIVDVAMIRGRTEAELRAEVLVLPATEMGRAATHRTSDDVCHGRQARRGL